MTLTIDLPDDLEAALKAQAHAQGVSTVGFVRQVLEQALTPQRAEEIDKNRRDMYQRGSVVEEMRKLRAHVKPDPEGWTTRDYIDHGRR